MTRRQRRLGLLLAALLCGGTALAFVLNAFRSNLVFFFSPTQVAAHEAPASRNFRLGGLVAPGSLKRDPENLTIRFVVTDTRHDIPVVYRGLLPDLFREGKGVVARGALDHDGTFVASEILAKHDENYMPPEAADALKRAASDNPTEKTR